MTVTFFGHADALGEVEPLLADLLVDLIEHQGATVFYVGDKGNFDYMVRKQLRKLSQVYPHIRYTVVLAYLPGKRSEFEPNDYADTMFPEELDGVHPRYAIDRRNRWMVERADTVVTYVKYSFGGAAKFKELAEKKGKCVINLPSIQ